jgi:hypothetical protein
LHCIALLRTRVARRHIYYSEFFETVQVRTCAPEDGALFQQRPAHMPILNMAALLIVRGANPGAALHARAGARPRGVLLNVVWLLLQKSASAKAAVLLKVRECAAGRGAAQHEPAVSRHGVKIPAQRVWFRATAEGETAGDLIVVRQEVEMKNI